MAGCALSSSAVSTLPLPIHGALPPPAPLKPPPTPLLPPTLQRQQLLLPVLLPEEEFSLWRRGVVSVAFVAFIVDVGVRNNDG